MHMLFVWAVCFCSVHQMAKEALMFTRCHAASSTSPSSRQPAQWHYWHMRFVRKKMVPCNCSQSSLLTTSPQPIPAKPAHSQECLFWTWVQANAPLKQTCVRASFCCCVHTVCTSVTHWVSAGEFASKNVSNKIKKNKQTKTLLHAA